jgi:hypothetical protein
MVSEGNVYSSVLRQWRGHDMWMVCYGLSCFRWYFKICENKESSCLNYYKFMAIMKYFYSNAVNFAEIYNIGENITYVWKTSFSTIIWCFRAQTILWRSLFQHIIYRSGAMYLSELEHLWKWGGGDILKILFEIFFYLQAVPKNFLVSYSTWTH